MLSLAQQRASPNQAAGFLPSGGPPRDPQPRIPHPADPCMSLPPGLPGTKQMYRKLLAPSNGIDLCPWANPAAPAAYWTDGLGGGHARARQSHTHGQSKPGP